MKFDYISAALGMILMILAFYYFEARNWQSLILSMLLSLGGLNALAASIESEKIRKLKIYLSIFTMALTTALVIKILVSA